MIRVLRNQIFLWKLCFRTCPGYMLYHLIAEAVIQVVQHLPGLYAVPPV